MKKNKLLAGVLSLAMAASMLPMTMLTASATETAVASKSGYIYYEDFEGDTYDTSLDIPSTITQRWSSTLTTDEETANKYLNYASKGQNLGGGSEDGYDDTTGNVYRLLWDETAVEIPDGEYELSYKVNRSTTGLAFAPVFGNGTDKSNITKVASLSSNYNVIGNWATSFVAGEWNTITVKLTVLNGQVSYNKTDLVVSNSAGTGNDSANQTFLTAGSEKVYFLGFVAEDGNSWASTTITCGIDDIYLRDVNAVVGNDVTFVVGNGQDNVVATIAEDGNGNYPYPKAQTASDGAFVGWYTDETYTTKYDGTNDDDNIVYAKWDKNYVYFENFENEKYYDTSFDMPLIIKDIWSNEIVTADDNSYMNYQSAASGIAGKSTDDGYAITTGNQYRTFWTDSAVELSDGEYVLSYRINRTGSRMGFYPIFGNSTDESTSVAAAHTASAYSAVGDWNTNFKEGEWNTITATFTVENGQVKIAQNEVVVENATNGSVASQKTLTYLTEGSEKVYFLGFTGHEGNMYTYAQTTYAIDDIYIMKPFQPSITYVTNMEGLTYDVDYVDMGGSIELPTPTSTDKRFLGWYTTADFQAGTEFTGENVTEDVTVYAKWSSDIFSATFDSETLTADEEMFLSPTMAEGTTQRWQSTRTDDGYMEYKVIGDYVSGNNVAFKVDLSLIKIDENATYEVGYSFNRNSSRGFDEIAELRLNNAYAKGDMAGWQVDWWSASNIDVFLSRDDVYPENSTDYSKTTYAPQNSNIKNMSGWTDVRIRFSLNGDTVTADNYLANGTATYYTTYTDTSGNKVAADPVSFTFASHGSSLKPISAFSYFATTETTTTARQTQVDESFYFDNFYIKIVKEETTDVKFMTGDEAIAGGVIEATATDGIISEVPDLTGAREGYVFEGWYTEENGGGSKLANDGSMVSGEEVTFYAYWVKEYTVTFIDRDSVIATETTTDGTVTVPETPENVEKFLGWYIEDTDTMFENGAVASDIRVVAKWSKVLYSATFDGELTEDEAKLAAVEYSDYPQRWTSEVEDGKIIYTVNTTETLSSNNNTIFSLNPSISLDENATYEISYKFDINTVRTLSNFGYVQLTGNNATRGLGAWNINDNYGNEGADTYARLTRADVYPETADTRLPSIEINMEEVEGYVDVKLRFSLNGDTLTDENYLENGTGTYYVTYRSTDGALITLEKDFTFRSHSNGLAPTTLTAFSASEATDKNYNTDGTSFYLDDVVVRVNPEKAKVTFDANGGAFGTSTTLDVEASLAGVVTPPTAPAYDGYAFSGWFFDKAGTKPFVTNNITEDVTVYARWQQTPNATFSIADASKKVPVGTDVVVTFDSELLTNTITTAGFEIYKGDTKLDSSSYKVTSKLDSARNTIVTIKFTSNLEYNTDYRVVLTDKVQNYYGGTTAETSFTTDVMAIKAVFDTTGMSHSTIGEAANGKFTLTFKVYSEDYAVE